MTPAQLEELKRLCDAATPGPWAAESYMATSGGPEIVAISTGGHGGRYALTRETAEFVAAARSVVPELIAEVERLRELVKDAECAGWRGPVVTPGACPWCVGEFRIFGGNGSTVLHAVDCPAFGPEGEVK